MAPYAYWLAFALLLLGIEMISGTFYMLVLSLAMALGSVAALSGLAMTWQISLAGVAAVAGILFLRRSRIARPKSANDGSFDIGQSVRVIAWREDGTARVQYRGAEWDAQPESAQTPHEATLYIKSMRSSTLILTHQKP